MCMGTVRVSARIATTHPIAAYGGFKLDEEDVNRLAAAIATGLIPMHFGHDITRPLDASNVEAGVERLEDGHFAVWAEFDTDADDWATYEAERDALGAPGGMSFSLTRPIPGIPREEEPQVVVAGDAGYYDDATILRASQQLQAVGVTYAERLYQFALGPDAKVIIEFISDGLVGIALNMIASGLYDAVKVFLKPGRSTVFDIIAKQRKSGRRILKLHLATDNADMAQLATERAAELLHTAATGTFAFDESAETFRHLGPAELDEREVAGPGLLGPQDGQAPSDEPDMLTRLGIVNRSSGLIRARTARSHLLAAGRHVLESATDYTVGLFVFSGFLARAQGFHDAAVTALEADNPYAAFTLLKAYAENAAAILYVKDKPDSMNLFWNTDSPAVPVGKLVNHAKKRFPGFKPIYKELSQFARPTARSLLASHRVAGDDARSVQWSSVPSFKSDKDAMIACAWVVELAEASSQLLVELAASWISQRPLA